jgi:hypothetical protein
MRKQPVFTISLMITGFVIGALGVLVLFAQWIEWFSFGNWNPISVRYAFDYFGIQPPHFISTALGVQKSLNWLRNGVLDLPLSVVLLGTGGLIAAIGGKHAPAKRAREKSN